jgi:tetratricopeptide (TPR) repeat protein
LIVNKQTFTIDSTECFLGRQVDYLNFVIGSIKKVIDNPIVKRVLSLPVATLLFKSIWFHLWPKKTGKIRVGILPIRNEPTEHDGQMTFTQLVAQHCSQSYAPEWTVRFITDTDPSTQEKESTLRAVLSSYKLDVLIHGTYFGRKDQEGVYLEYFNNKGILDKNPFYNIDSVMNGKFLSDLSNIVNLIRLSKTIDEQKTSKMTGFQQLYNTLAMKFVPKPDSCKEDFNFSIEEIRKLEKDVKSFKIWVNPYHWATKQGMLGTIYSVVANSHVNNDFYEKAISCFQMALTVFNKTTAPFEYFAAKNSLGNLYSELSNRISDKSHYIKASINCFDEALSVAINHSFNRYIPAIRINRAFVLLKQNDNEQVNIQIAKELLEAELPNLDKDKDLDFWVNAHMGLSKIYTVLGDSEKSDVTNYIKALNIAEAVTLTIKKDLMHLSWQDVEKMKGMLFSKIGERTEGTYNFKNALICYENALEFIQSDIRPIDWAEIQHNMGLAYRFIGERCLNSLENHRESAFHFEQALTRYDPQLMPVHWSQTQFAYAETALVIAELSELVNDYRDAVQAFEDLLSFYNPDHENYTYCQSNLKTAKLGLEAENKEF